MENSTLNNSSKLFEREEEYKRLNAELEARTARLVEEAEVMMKEQETFLNRSPVLQEEQDPAIVDVIGQDMDLLSIAAGGFDNELYNNEEDVDNENLNKNYKTSLTSSVPINNFSTKSDQNISDKKSKDAFTGEKPMSARSQPKSVSRKKIQETTKRSNDYQLLDAAAEMGSEAQIRFLKAKLRVLQEELDDSVKQGLKLTEDCRKCKHELREAQEENEKIKKNFNQQQIQVQKLKAGFEEEKRKNEMQSVQIQNIKKELDAIKREKKQSATSHNATEVRLNRATEELEKLKVELQKQKKHEKDSSNIEQQEIEKLRIDNKRLERLRSDCMTVMKKQQKMIGILKRQILHIEAAKVLSFTEEEFVKALDWGKK